MFRYVVAVLLFLGTGQLCFSHETPRTVQLPGIDVDSTLAYVSSGNIHLLLHDYELALADFNRASFCTELFDDFNPEYDLLILFGKTVAYDNLDVKDKCEQSLSSLILTLNQIQKESDEDSDLHEEEDDDDDDEDFEAFWQETIDYMRRIAKLAPSTEIREALISIVEEMYD